jgi:hypothetical protein
MTSVSVFIAELLLCILSNLWNVLLSSHFENLATPNLDENKFDLERNSLCTIQNDIIAEETANKVKIPPATEAEVKQAIRKLNNGKAADENGIQAEHFKFANAELVTEICSITNQIFEEFDIDFT